jgi:oligoribonuclease NrnB/cAMP/cGMP phosphodiesterase (DHH superfamily)
MLGLFDSWNHEDNPRILNLEYALQALDTRPMTDTWASILEMSEKELMDNYDKCGGFIRGREEKINLRNAVHSHSTKYGKYSVTVLNSSGKGSGVFAGKLSSHDIGVSYSIRGNSCSCGVYSLNPDIDVSVIAKAFGGGGHKGAAGFNLPVPVFFRLFGLNGSHDKQ